ncbi:MAG: hypothetical protein Q4C72_07295 [Eubacteriales bacterium]|nr:hypothetical protein [Eubacteriales bacterium]
MYDYMKSLHRQFFREPECSELRREMEKPLQALRDGMDKEGRRKLLYLVDCQSALREEVSLRSFLAGYRLACGICRELQQELPHSFDQEEEKRATELYKIKKRAAEAACTREEA